MRISITPTDGEAKYTEDVPVLAVSVRSLSDDCSLDVIFDLMLRNVLKAYGFGDKLVDRYIDAALAGVVD